MCAVRDVSVAVVTPSTHAPERLLQVAGHRRVHGLVAADVVLSRDRGISVTEQFRRELETPRLVDGSARGAAEPM